MDTIGHIFMNTYAPLWNSIVDSSLWCEPDNVVKVFLTMLAKKDADHVVRGSAFNIAQWAKKTEAEVLESLKVLAAPDRTRLEPQPFEGRRIEKHPDGWLVLNGDKYRMKMREANRREYQRQKQAEYRARKKGKVSAEYLDREKRYVQAHNDGNHEACDRIAAEGL